MAKEHYLDDSVVAYAWDNSNPPRLSIEPCDTVTFACQEASGLQIKLDSDAASLAALDFDKVDTLTGPVYVNGAVVYQPYTYCGEDAFVSAGVAFPRLAGGHL